MKEYMTPKSELSQRAATLWRAYMQGNMSAMEELVELTRRPLFAFILSARGQADWDADDIFQETWLRTLRRRRRVKPDHVLSWLFRVARNLIIDRGRTAKPITPLDGAESAVTQKASNDPSPAEDTARRELVQILREAVERLPAEQKEVFVLRTEGQMPFKEIARIQGVSINTALARMQYAVGKLKAELRREA